MHTRRRSAFGCCSAEITRAIENGAKRLRLVLDVLDLEPDHGELVGELFQRLVGVEMFLQPGEREFHGTFLENLNQTKAFAHQHHVFAKLALPAEISAVRVVASSRGCGRLRLLRRRRPHRLRGSGDRSTSVVSITQAGVAASVEHDPAFARRRRVRLVLGGAGRGLHALDHEVEQFVGQFRPVAEGERAQALIFRRDALTCSIPRRASGRRAA